MDDAMILDIPYSMFFYKLIKLTNSSINKLIQDNPLYIKNHFAIP